MASNASATGSAAWGNGAAYHDMGSARIEWRPIGVATRLWSPKSAPAGRTPGVTIRASGPSSSRSVAGFLRRSDNARKAGLSRARGERLHLIGEFAWRGRLPWRRGRLQHPMLVRTVMASVAVSQPLLSTAACAASIIGNAAHGMHECHHVGSRLDGRCGSACDLVPRNVMALQDQETPL